MSPPVAAILGFLKILFFLLLEIPFLVLWGIHAENVYFVVVVLFWSVFSWRFLSHFQEMLVSLTPHRIALGKCCSERESFPLAGRDGEGEEVGGGGGGGGPTSSASPLLHFFSSSTVSWNNKERARNCWLAPFSRSIYGRFHVNFEQLFPSRSNGGQILLVKRWISSWISGRFPPPSFVQLTTPFSWLIDSVAIQKEENK